MDGNDDDRRAEQRRLQDLKDLQKENSGLDTGRALRFTSPDNTPEAREARKRDERWYFSRMLTYAEKLQHMRDMLARLDRDSYQALLIAERRANEAAERLEETRA